MSTCGCKHIVSVKSSLECQLVQHGQQHCSGCIACLSYSSLQAVANVAFVTSSSKES